MKNEFPEVPSCDLPSPEVSPLISSATLLTTTTPKAIDVVVAIFCRQQSVNQVITEVLLTLRPQGRVFAGFWEFPGGKIEANESAESALIREIQEELGVTIKTPQFIARREHTYPHGHVRLQFFVVKSWQGTLQLREHDGMIWQDIHHINVSPLLPANEGLLDSFSTLLNQ